MSLTYLDNNSHGDMEDELAQLTTQISALESSQDELARVMKNLRVKAARIQNSKVAVSRLPSDVLALIFEECHQSNPQWTGVLCLLGQLPVEVRLSHVCSQWRGVALATPSLWSSIRFPFEQREDSLLEYLERSRGSLLDVYLGPWAKYPNLERTLTTVLVPHVHRFRQLILEAVSRESLSTLLSAFQDQSAPALRRLRVMCRGTIVTPGPMTGGAIFSNGAPLLTDVRLDNVPVILPNSVTTMLSFSAYPGPPFPMSREGFYRTLSACPSLTTLHLRGFIELGSQTPVYPVLLPHLRELVVNGRMLGNGLRLFDLISTPNLETLVLEDVKAHALVWIHRYIASSYPHAFQGLHTLRYIRCDFGGVDMDVHFLRATPAITDLVLSVDRHMRLIRLLNNSDKQALVCGCSPMWPNLRKITLHTQGYAGNVTVGAGVPLNEPSPTMALLQEFVACRNMLRRPLANLSFKGHNAGPVNNEFLWGLNQMKQYVPTEVAACPMQAMLADSGYVADWAATVEAYSSQLRHFLGQVSLVRQQMTPVIPPSFNIHHLRRRIGVPT
ncbi:hypothetical protein SCLCIDRAFT_1223925 [Scleroderma citrinum Foug A]|uniref:Uncharacterized protein n=1 Tax=Scleroderma citrinum Foug A TaxID=1036808 RepID=A0A0C2ZHF6_9AGAM|nr:hypothetical protein SCLCIDRAFT_1223925 [Scleroderma citrinum Foug A]